MRTTKHLKSPTENEFDFIFSQNKHNELLILIMNEALIRPVLAPDESGVLPHVAAVAAAASAAACLCPLRSNFLGPAQIRLSGGRTRYEGRVEVLSSQPNGTQRWGLICGETWTTREAMVACRQLGLGYANQGVQVS